MEAQVIGDPGYQGIECGITGEAEDVIDVVVRVRPVHRLDAAVMAVAAPHDAGGRPMPSQMLRHVLDDGPHLRALRGARRAQDRHHRRAASRVIDVHRREAALVVMGVPERQLLAAMRRTEGVVDVEDLQLARLHRRAELIKQSPSEPRRPPVLLGAFSRRAMVDSRGQRCAGYRTAADRDLHERIMPQPVKINGILMAAGDRCDARHHHLEHRVPDAVRIAAIRHRIGEPPAHAELALSLPEQQQPGIGGLGAAVKIHCEFLAMDRWQIEGKRCSVGHGGCGARLIREATRLDTDLLRESLALRHSRHINLMRRA